MMRRADVYRTRAQQDSQRVERYRSELISCIRRIFVCRPAQYDDDDACHAKAKCHHANAKSEACRHMMHDTRGNNITRRGCREGKSHIDDATLPP